jgi:hypothetical protein
MLSSMKHDAAVAAVLAVVVVLLQGHIRKRVSF